MVSIKSLATAARDGLNFDYSNDKVRGINLGGWFVLEPWITPSIFNQWANGGGVVDEYTYTQALGPAQASSRLNQHWSTFITQDDFNEIASMGLNHVRIPIGYWALNPQPGDPYVQGQLPYLDQAIGWARTPGSQNGFDNSGRTGPIKWISGGNAPATVQAIANLASRYARDSDVVTAIELLNEPASWGNDMGAVKKFYYDGWGTVRSNGQQAVVIHDAFLDITSYWNGFMTSGFSNVIIDTHLYQIFSPGEVAMRPCEHIRTACGQGPKLASADKRAIVGEWSGAQTDCAKWLNGLGKGARYDGTFPGSSYNGNCQTKYQGTVDGLLNTDKINLEYYIEAQMDAYERNSGWVFWTWKTESAPEWHFQNLTRAGLIPQPLTSRKHPGQCQASACMIPGY
ncbi:hypothetical protein B7494_g6517 [Chlorociboria aeruginascens]|nr:hypothetical protein B7494_g6517 [Chlorociboria aeruginascens]